MNCFLYRFTVNTTDVVVYAEITLRFNVCETAYLAAVKMYNTKYVYL